MSFWVDHSWLFRDSCLKAAFFEGSEKNDRAGFSRYNMLYVGGLSQNARSLVLKGLRQF